MSYYGPVKHLRLDKDKNEISPYTQNDQNCLLKGFAAVYVRALFLLTRSHFFGGLWREALDCEKWLL